MSKPKTKIMDIDALAELPVQRAIHYLQFIAEHDLWDELHDHLKDHGCKHFKISWETIHAIATVVDQKPTAQGRIGCASNGPLGPRPGPVLPTPASPDGGAPDGGAPNGG